MKQWDFKVMFFLKFPLNWEI